jgi:hypothetical protein
LFREYCQKGLASGVASVMADRLLIGGGGTDKDVLTRLAGEDLDIALNLFGSESDPVNDNIEGVVAQQCLYACPVFVDIAFEHLDALWYQRRPLASIEDIQFDATLRGQGGAGSADRSCAPDEQDFHVLSLPVRSAGRAAYSRIP